MTEATSKISCKFSRVDGFSVDSITGGNPASCVLSGQLCPTPEARFLLAKTLGYSETVFVDRITAPPPIASH